MFTPLPIEPPICGSNAPVQQQNCWSVPEFDDSVSPLNELEWELKLPDDTALRKRDREAIRYMQSEWHYSYFAACAFHDQLMLRYRRLLHLNWSPSFVAGRPVNLAVEELLPNDAISFIDYPPPLKRAVERKFPLFIETIKNIESKQEQWNSNQAVAKEREELRQREQLRLQVKVELRRQEDLRRQEELEQNVSRKPGRPGVAGLSVKAFQQRRERGILPEGACIDEARAILRNADAGIWPSADPPDAKTIAKHIRDEHKAAKR
jgi:hypothetical protein